MGGHRFKQYRDRQGAAPSGDGWPVAYLVTFRCYGTWLHGDPRGTVDRNHRRHGDPLSDAGPALWKVRKQQLPQAPVRLDAEHRGVVAQAIRDVCAHRDWHLHALNIRTNHVHVVVAALCLPEVVMTSFKAWSTRRLREHPLVGSDANVWSRHGSTRYLWSEQAVVSACSYTEEAQGADLPLQEP